MLLPSKQVTRVRLPSPAPYEYLLPRLAGEAFALYWLYMASDFYKAVYQLVCTIPPGMVATYGQVAALLGRPKGARLVGWALNTCPDNIPWQRVINRQGMISIENLRASKELQAQLLQVEGVSVEMRNGNYWIDLKIYGWKPTAP